MEIQVQCYQRIMFAGLVTKMATKAVTEVTLNISSYLEDILDCFLSNCITDLYNWGLQTPFLELFVFVWFGFSSQIVI